MCDKKCFIKNAVTFLFSNRFQHGSHRPEGLIFDDLMQFEKIKIQLIFIKT